jgi:formamidopyrimidine-DNA glycosylase
MIELPEAVTLARQVAEELQGATVASCERGNTPHKWAWYSAEPAEYERVTAGKTVGGARAVGNRVAISLEPGYILAIGDMGGKVLLHADEGTLPKKRHLMVGFEDGRYLTVAIQGWGGMWLMTEDALSRYAASIPVSPISDEFTYDRFKELLADDAHQGKRSVKAFMASRPRISGVGNGYVQDICFRAGLHPRRDLLDLTGRERQRWYHAIRKTLGEAIKRGGRDTETNLYGEPGGFVPILDRRTNGQPCPECGTAIEKIAYRGGSCYFCPKCQK